MQHAVTFSIYVCMDAFQVPLHVLPNKGNEKSGRGNQHLQSFFDYSRQLSVAIHDESFYITLRGTAKTIVQNAKERAGKRQVEVASMRVCVCVRVCECMRVHVFSLECKLTILSVADQTALPDRKTQIYICLAAHSPTIVLSRSDSRISDLRHPEVASASHSHFKIKALALNYKSTLINSLGVEPTFNSLNMIFWCLHCSVLWAFVLSRSVFVCIFVGVR